MPLPVIADVFRCAFEWEHVGTNQSAVNVMHFSGPGKTAANVQTALLAHVDARMFAPVRNSCDVKNATITPLDGSTASLVTGPMAGWVGGATTGDTIPGTSAVVSLRSALRGRSNRGRVFLPFISESAQADGLLVGGYITDLLAGWGAFATAMAAAGIALGIASYKNANWHQATTVLIDTRCGTQRRRQERV